MCRQVAPSLSFAIFDPPCTPRRKSQLRAQTAPASASRVDLYAGGRKPPSTADGSRKAWGARMPKPPRSATGTESYFTWQARRQRHIRGFLLDEPLRSKIPQSPRGAMGLVRLTRSASGAPRPAPDPLSLRCCSGHRVLGSRSDSCRASFF